MTGNRRPTADEPGHPQDKPTAGPQSTLQTEFEFTLPHGYVDDDGTLHTEGTMRLASAADEIKPLKDPRVQANESYLTVILLSRVVTTLGSLSEVTPGVIEDLFVTDLAHLQDLYERINTRNANVIDTVCPECGEHFEATVDSETSSVPELRADPDQSTGNAEE